MGTSGSVETIWDKVGWTAPPILAKTDDQKDAAVRHVCAYFEQLSDDHCGYRTGTCFSDLGGGGDRPEVANVITAEDIVAVESLDVTIPRIHKLQLLGAGVTPSGRAATRAWVDGLDPDEKLDADDYPSARKVPIDSQRVTAALARIPNEVDLADVPKEEAPEVIRNANLLWREVRRTDFGQTMVSKLLARKRPRLLPIIDKHIQIQLGYQRKNVNFYETMWKVMSDSDLARPVLLATIRNAAYEKTGDERIRRLSDLRVFDIVVWMHEKYPVMSSRGRPTPNLADDSRLLARRVLNPG